MILTHQKYDGEIFSRLKCGSGGSTVVVLRWWCGGGGSAVVVVLCWWFCGGDSAVDPPVSLTLRTGVSTAHELQRKYAKCLLLLVQKFSDDYSHGHLDFRRRVWESHVDGSSIIGEMLIDKIGSEEFYSLRDEDAIGVCLLAVLHMVLLGQEPKNNVPNWWLRLVDDPNMWEKYPWGAEPIGRLRPDAFEDKAEWWVSSRAFFDGRIYEPPQIPPAVRNDIYQRVDEQARSIKELQQQNVDQYKILNSTNKHFEGFPQCGPQLFTTQASSSFFEGAQMTPTYPGTPHIETPMAQPGFASCSSRYPPSHPDTSYIGTPMALQGFAPFSSNYQAGPSHNRGVGGVNPVIQ
ncbi:phospholipase-like protein [Tanacetum coccineum]